jgi:hypothetical protein
MITHSPYPGDVSDPEWGFVLSCLCLLPEADGQRVPNLRDGFALANQAEQVERGEERLARRVA